jgi:peroxiredoxin
MAQLRQDFPAFVAQEAVILVVGPEGPETFKSYWQAHRLPFVGLPDPSHQVLKLFGQEIKLFRWGRMPAQVVVDKQGLARFVHYGDSMSDIPDNQELLGLLAELNSSYQDGTHENGQKDGIRLSQSGSD